LVKSGELAYYFQDGVLQGSIAVESNLTALPTLYVGQRAFATTFAEYLTGYLDSVRVTEGVARYTANFNPETDTFLDI
jgi:hypothetical protein